MNLGKNYFINLNVSPIDAGSQNYTQGAPSEKARKKDLVKIINWDLSSGSKNDEDICESLNKSYLMMKPSVRNVKDTWL